MSRSSKRGLSTWGAALAGVLMLLGLPIAAGWCWPWVVYLPGWVVVPAATREPVRLENVALAVKPSGGSPSARAASKSFRMTSKRIEFTADSVRDGSAGITDKRRFRFGTLTFVER
jgi:hypothetical protein